MMAGFHPIFPFVAAALVALLTGQSYALADVRVGSTEAKIYRNIQSHLACFRRMNATHTTGCSSDLSGNVGVLYKVDSKADLQVIIKDGPHSPYIPILYSENFNREFLVPMKESNRVSGVLLLRRQSPEKIDKFSMEKTCPNQGHGIYTKPTDPHYCERWNSEGTGLLHEDFNFPIFLINEYKEGEKVLACYEDFNAPIDGKQRDWPLCAAQLESHMSAAVDTVTCIRRTNRDAFPPSRICDPMGDVNLWAPIIPKSQAKPYREKSVIVIAARMDASSMFDQLAPGGDSAATGIASIMAITKILSQFKNELNQSTIIDNIWIMLFNGEAYDYIGSGRIAYEMKSNNFPVSAAPNSSLPAILNLENVKFFIELNQVATNSSENKYYIHALNQTIAEDLSTALKTAGGTNVSFVDTSSEVGLPPSSYQTFLAHYPGIPGVVITNYDKEFKNKFYNSFHDDATNLGYKYTNGTGYASNTLQGRIAELSAAVAQAVIQIALPQETITVEPDYACVDETLSCLLVSPNCTYFREIAGDDILQPYPYQMYVGVAHSPNSLSNYLMHLMMSLQGDKQNVTESACGNLNDGTKKNIMYRWVGKACYATTVNYTYAYSPVFDSNMKISKPEWDSGLYSTWTESVWQKLSVRIFLKPSMAHDVSTLASGITVFIVSFACIGWISRKSDVIFPTRPDVVC